MNFLDVIGPGDPRYVEIDPVNPIIPAIIIGSVVVLVAVVLIIAVNAKKKGK
jgi:hypothetical protein